MSEGSINLLKRLRKLVVTLVPSVNKVKIELSMTATTRAYYDYNNYS